METLTDQKAKELNQIVNNLKKKFEKARKQRILEEDSKVKEYAPITGAIEKLGETITQVDEGIKNVLEQNKTLIADLVPFTRNIAEMEIPPSEEETSFERELFKTPISKSTPMIKDSPKKKNINIPEPITEEQEEISDTTSESSMISESGITSSPRKPKTIETSLGQFELTDKHYGLKWYEDQKKFMIGNHSVNLVGDNVVINGITYKGTNGLWRLLTQDVPHLKDKSGKNRFTEEDFKNYKEILLNSSAIYQNDNPSTNRPKAPQSKKYKKFIKRIYEESKIPVVTGEGIKNYNQHSVMYINNLSELISRLNLIMASEIAGDNNFHNEKVGVIRFLTDLLEKHIDDRKGTEYLIRIVNALPKKIINDETIGSGLFNTILNKLPFELHYPGYNYLGPGTKLCERLERGDKPINKLDGFAKEHDISYRDHKGLPERHIADKILENKAWDRVISKDADIGERIAAYLTTNAMKIKRHLGMGLMDSELDIFQ